MEKEEIIISDYNPDWAKQFETIKNALAKYLDDTTIGIAHIGSTSIPGMKAKPIIDIDIIIEDNNIVLKNVISKLEEIGYIHLGNMGITGREAFKRMDLKTPKLGSNKTWFNHNLYLCKKGSIGLSNHLNLRNYLLENPSKVVEYSNLKLELIEKYPFDIDSYVDGKTNFIVDILNETGMNTNDTFLIEKQNKLKDGHK